MDIVFLLIAISGVLIGIIAWAFFWAVDSGQFEDLDAAGHAILMDDDDAPPRPRAPSASTQC